MAIAMVYSVQNTSTMGLCFQIQNQKTLMLICDNKMICLDDGKCIVQCMQHNDELISINPKAQNSKMTMILGCYLGTDDGLLFSHHYTTMMMDYKVYTKCDYEHKKTIWQWTSACKLKQDHCKIKMNYTTW